MQCKCGLKLWGKCVRALKQWWCLSAGLHYDHQRTTARYAYAFRGIDLEERNKDGGYSE